MADNFEQALLEASINEDTWSDERALVVDPIKRTIAVPPGFFFGVYNDKDVLKVPFIIPRSYGNVDFSEYDIFINYMNSAGYGNVYAVENPDVGDDYIRFYWVLGRGVFVKEGTVRFIVCIRKFDTGGIVTNEFNTTVASASVLYGLEVDENPDPVAYSILAHMQELETASAESASAAEASAEAAAESEETILDNMAELTEAIAKAHLFYSGPLVATTASGMTDVTRVYVYTGSETGYTAGNWYYYNGSAWTSGGVYNAVAVNTDETLSVEGAAADAKATGDEIALVKQDINKSPSLKESTEEDVDLDITDSNGNVIVRFEDGHIKTKEFDSSNIEPAPIESGNVEARVADTNADLDITDSAGNVIAEFSGGHIKTKNFNSDGVSEGLEIIKSISGTDYIKTFTYDPASASTQTINGEFTEGSTILCHMSNAADDVTDILNTRWATYKYIDTNNVEHTLGMERPYNFARYILPEDATAIVAYFPTELLEAGSYTCKFLVYKLGAYKRQPHIVTVGADGKRMFTSVRAAMDSFHDNNAYNTYEIWVYPGTYNILSDYTDEEIRAEGFKGLWVKNGVTIKGIGHREQIILHGELDPDDYSSTIRNQISTLNMSGNCGLENLTVTNQYNRYAVHDDHMSGFYQEQTRIVENCKFLSWNASSGGIGQAAYGAGGHNNKKLFIRNCDLGDRLIIHNTQLMTVSMTAVVENSFAQQVTLTDNNNTGFTAKTRIEFDNCNFDYIMHDRTSDGTEPTMILCGTGTHNAKVDCEAGTLYNFGDCMTFPAQISAGQSVKQTGIRTVVATTSLDDIYGISIGYDSLHTYVQRQGYIAAQVLGLSGLSVGDYVTLDSSGVVTATGATASNAIGRVESIADNTSTAFIKLLF